jgi:flagellar biosynthesis protein FliR
MKSRRVTTSIKTVLSFIVFAAILVACDNQQGMMHGGGGSTYMGNWSWAGILIGLAIGFLIGYLVGRRSK